MMKNQYFKQADILIRILPFLSQETDFALKGGTAINFFVHDLPRISVDIDLTYLPVNDRDIAIQGISLMLVRYSSYIQQIFPSCKITRKKLKGSELIKGLIIHYDNITVKIEPNLVIRGCVFPPQILSLCSKAKEIFQKDVKVQILSTADLYAGKICAALDRQHPRDLFDIKLLLEKEGITDDIRKAFIVYLLSHPRPIIELLNPNRIDISKIFETEFKAMTDEEITLKKLLESRDKLIKKINRSLSEKEKRFIISFKNMKPEWELLGLKNIENLPAIRWKLYNLVNMNAGKHKTALDKLREFFKVG